MTDLPENTVAVSGNVFDTREEHMEALAAFRRECIRRGFRTMQVMTQNVNGAAIGLYRGAGWQTTGVSR